MQTCRDFPEGRGRACQVEGATEVKARDPRGTKLVAECKTLLIILSLDDRAMGTPAASMKLERF